MLHDHQVGFRTFDSTAQQLHRVTDFISTALELKLFASGAFLDMTPEFDKVMALGPSF